jgi:hypothetical protein
LEGPAFYHSDSYLKYLRTHPAVRRSSHTVETECSPSHVQYEKAAKAGIDHLTSHFPTSSPYTLTTLFEQKPVVQLANGTEVAIRDLDVGLNGILDKVCETWRSALRSHRDVRR